MLQEQLFCVSDLFCLPKKSGENISISIRNAKAYEQVSDALYSSRVAVFGQPLDCE